MPSVDMAMLARSREAVSGVVLSWRVVQLDRHVLGAGSWAGTQLKLKHGRHAGMRSNAGGTIISCWRDDRVMLERTTVSCWRDDRLKLTGRSSHAAETIVSC